MSHRTDEQLVRSLEDGDREALTELYERHAPWLLGRLSHRCSDPELVDQAVQDTFLAIWRKPANYRGEGAVAAWIWGVGIRRLMDQLRRRRPLERSSAMEATMTSAEEEVLTRIEHGGLASALASLSPELRAVVQATVLDGLTTREASRVLGIPAGTVKTRMMRARHEMREALA